MTNFARLLRHVVLCLLVGLTVGPVRAGQAMVGVHIALKPEAILTTRHFTVADIAVVSANNPQVKDAVGMLGLGSAPRVGYVEQLTREALAQLIRSRLTLHIEKMEWSGARAVKIHSATQLADTNAVVDAAKAYLLKELGSKFESVDVQVVSPIADLALPVGEATFRAREIDPKHVFSRVPVWVDIYVDGVVYRSVIVPFAVRARQSVYVAKRDLPEGAVVSSADFDLRIEDVSEISHDLIPASGMQGVVRVRRALVNGQIATRNHLSLQGMVLRGDWVKLVLADGGVLIETRGVAQQEAGIGQIVKVKPEKSTEAVAGRVVSPGVVQADGG